MSTVRLLLQEAVEQLKDSDSARLDAEVLLSFALDRSRTWLHTWSDKCPDSERVEHFRTLIARRAAGEPVAYLTGTREFWGMALACDASTLIPRPDTELLVERALELDLPEAAQVLDLGTGTGAIALALAKERPRWHIRATDCSAGAIKLARANAKTHGITRVKWFKGDWFQPLDADLRFDLIVSNPPYIAENDPHLQRGDLRFEPRSALVSGVDGLNAIRRLSASAGSWLNPRGYLMVEHGFNQAPGVRALLTEHGFSCVQSVEDLAGHKRVSYGWRISN